MLDLHNSIRNHFSLIIKRQNEAKKSIKEELNRKFRGTKNEKDV